MEGKGLAKEDLSITQYPDLVECDRQLHICNPSFFRYAILSRKGLDTLAQVTPKCLASDINVPPPQLTGPREAH